MADFDRIYSKDDAPGKSFIQARHLELGDQIFSQSGHLYTIKEIAPGLHGPDSIVFNFEEGNNWASVMKDAEIELGEDV